MEDIKRFHSVDEGKNRFIGGALLNRGSTKNSNMEAVFLSAEMLGKVKTFNISKDYNFPKVPLTEENIKLPFECIRIVFADDGLRTSFIHDSLYYIKSVKIVNKGIFYLFEIEQVYLFLDPEKLDGEKVKESDEETMPFYLAFKLENMELVLDNEVEEGYEKRMLQGCLNINFFETSHKLLQIIAFLNSANKDYKVVKRETSVKTTEGKKRDISYVIYLSKKQEQRLINNGLKAPYQKPRYSFRVRGHVRHLRSPRYITEKKEVFIENYVKYANRELFINKEYKIK